MHTTEEHKACQGHAGDTLKQTSAAHPFDAVVSAWTLRVCLILRGSPLRMNCDKLGVSTRRVHGEHRYSGL